MRRSHLSINDFPFPSFLIQKERPHIRCFRYLPLTVKENENVVFKYGDDITEFVAIVVKWVGVTPDAKERSLTQIS